MSFVLKILSIIGLGLTLFPSLLVFGNAIDLELHKNLMIIGTLLWFLTAPFWMNKNEART